MQQELNRVLFLSLVILGVFAAFSVNAQAVCPVCVVAIGAGLGLSRWLKVDDLVSSVWIGAFLLTIVIWTIYWLKKRNWNFKYNEIVTFLFYYVLTFIPLYYAKFVGIIGNSVLGIDKVILGTAAGTIVLWFGLWLHGFLKAKNGNKVYFPYQRVVIPVLALILTSLIFYLLLIYKVI